MKSHWSGIAALSASQRRRGFSLVLVLFLFMAFVAAYPLIFRQTESGFYRSRTLYLWSRLHNAAESGLQLANSLGRQAALDAGPPDFLAEPGVTSFSYTLQANATFTIDVKYQFTYGDPKHSLLSIATSSVFVDGNRQPSGFEGLKIDATVPLLNLDMPASYSDWHLTTFTP